MAKVVLSFAAAVLVLMVMVGCSTTGGVTPGQIVTGVKVATAPIDNPITPTREVQIEAAIDAGFVVLNSYRDLCIAKKADKNCRANIAAMQRYTRQMPALTAKLRTFVDQNKQVNAIAIYKQLASLYEPFKQIAGSLGYNVGSLP